MRPRTTEYVARLAEGFGCADAAKQIGPRDLLARPFRSQAEP